jgi:glucosamine--fructose-6-phosphate aminotransferase (isomerizing)
LVHNGIINNFSDLKLKLIKHGVNFIGETDTEVIANLIEYYILQFNLSIEDAIKTTLLELEGTWALIIIYTKQPGSYYITRKGSPLLLGKTENYIMCSSELNGFNGLIYDYIVLNNNDIIKITNNNYFSINNTNNDTNNHTNNHTNNSINNYVIKKNIQDKSLYNNEYKHWMLKEIMEQSETIQKAYNYGGRILNNNIKLGGLDNLKDMIINYSIENIVLIGCGTSYHAGLLGEIYLRSSKSVVNISCFNACEFNKNCLPNTNKTIITLFLSQSGETLDVYNSLKICKQHNCITVGLINKVDSLIARSVDCGIYLNAGDEISVPSTKSFTSMIICLSLFDLWFSYLYNNKINNLKIINNMRSLSSSIYHILNDFDIRKNINNISNYIIEKNISNIFILGKKKLYPIALESALKIKEVTYIHAEGFSSGSLKHGPFSLLDNLNLTILLIDYNDTDNYNSLKSTFYEL